MNKNINNIFLVIIILFSVIAIDLIYIQMINPQKILGHPENVRYILEETEEPRGNIYSIDGTLLAQSKPDGQTYIRYYPFNEILEPVLGFFNPKYGKSGIEQAYDDIIGYKKWPGLVGTLSRLVSMNFSDEPNTVTLTINLKLQKKAYELLSGRNGAVVAVNPENGEIIALASSPSFDPNTLIEEWDTLSQDENSPFINRTTSGLYPPGSVFKIITAAAALDKEVGMNKIINCKGKIEIGGNVITEFEGKQHGEVELEQAFVQSCNIFFASLAIDLGADIISEYSAKFGFGKTIPFDLPIEKSQLGITDQSDDVALAWSGIGQAKVLTTPFQMALVACAIANDGIIMEPHLLKEAKSDNGKVLLRAEPKILFRSIEKKTADKISEMMEEVIKSGTGKSAGLPEIETAGKTGTAEVIVGRRPHSWFVGFAPAKDPVIVLSIIIENCGAGSGEAAYLFKEIANEYLKEF